MTVEQLKETLKAVGQRLAEDAEFKNLRDFYQQKIEQGAVIRHDYTLPPFDTVGRELATANSEKHQSEAWL